MIFYLPNSESLLFVLTYKARTNRRILSYKKVGLITSFT